MKGRTMVLCIRRETFRRNFVSKRGDVKKVYVCVILPFGIIQRTHGVLVKQALTYTRGKERNEDV